MCLGASAAERPLTLVESERLALTHQYGSSSFLLNSSSADSEEDKNNPSPTNLTFATNNFSPNTSAPGQIDMTVINVGVKQVFNRSDVNSYKSDQVRAQAQAKAYRQQNKAELLLRDVRRIWIELYYLQHASAIVQASVDHLQQTVALVHSPLSGNQALGTTPHSSLPINEPKVSQTSMHLDLEYLKQLQTETMKQMAVYQKKLAALIGKNEMNRPLDTNLPSWPAPASLIQMQKRLARHPLLKADDAEIQANQADLGWNKELHKTQFEVGASYGVRQADMMQADPQLNMVSAELTMKLPTSSQPSTIRISTNQLDQAQMQRQRDHNNLVKNLIKQYNIWLKLNQSTTSQSLTLPVIPAPTQTTLPGNQAELTTHKFIQQVNRQLFQLRSQANLAQARSDLEYFHN